MSLHSILFSVELFFSHEDFLCISVITSTLSSLCFTSPVLYHKMLCLKNVLRGLKVWLDSLIIHLYSNLFQEVPNAALYMYWVFVYEWLEALKSSHSKSQLWESDEFWSLKQDPWCGSCGAKQRTQFVFFKMFSLFNWYTWAKPAHPLHVLLLPSPGNALSAPFMSGTQFPFPCSLYWQIISDEGDKVKATGIQTSNLEQQEIHVAKCPIYHYQHHWTQHLSALLNHHGLYKPPPSQFLNVFVVLYNFSL